MIKRFVILQDEQLVVRELTRVGRPQSPTRWPASVRARTSAVARGRAPGTGRDRTWTTNSCSDDVAGHRPEDRRSRRSRSRVDRSRATVIAETLRQVHWNRRKAAEQLGVSYKTLLNKIKESGI